MNAVTCAGGSVLEAMAEAVEKAAVVLVCLTQKYKESPNCRTGECTFPPVQRRHLFFFSCLKRISTLLRPRLVLVTMACQMNCTLLYNIVLPCVAAVVFRFALLIARYVSNLINEH